MDNVTNATRNNKRMSLIKELDLQSSKGDARQAHYYWYLYILHDKNDILYEVH